MFENPVPVRSHLCQTKGILLYYNKSFLSAVLQGIKVFGSGSTTSCNEERLLFCFTSTHGITVQCGYWQEVSSYQIILIQDFKWYCF